MAHFSSIDILGYLAGALVLTTFYLKTMLRLRTVAIFSNVAFISYGLATGAVPILVLHLLLLPLNTIRLLQMKTLIKRVAEAKGELSMSLLVPYMQVRKYPGGRTIFNKGDPADAVYYVLDGWLATVEHDVELGPGSLIGEIGVFAPDNKRSDGVICKTDVELASISASKIWELFYQHPEFGAHLIRIIAQRAAWPAPTKPIGQPDATGQVGQPLDIGFPAIEDA